MPHCNWISSNRTARALALVALLCAAALQVQEANHGHWHGLDDSYSQCLVGNNGNAPAVPLDALPVLPRAALAAPATLLPVALAVAPVLPFQPRGPPHIS